MFTSGIKKKCLAHVKCEQTFKSNMKLTNGYMFEDECCEQYFSYTKVLKTGFNGVELHYIFTKPRLDSGENLVERV